LIRKLRRAVSIREVRVRAYVNAGDPGDTGSAATTTKSAPISATSGHRGCGQQGETVDEEQRRWAIRRILAKRRFWIHFGVYLAVNALMVLVWAVASVGYFWPVWPMLG
jgi:hypothetical protein